MRAIDLIIVDLEILRFFPIDGEPWFIGSDLCKILELKEGYQTYKHLSPYEYMVVSCITVLSMQAVKKLISLTRYPLAPKYVTLIDRLEQIYYEDV